MPTNAFARLDPTERILKRAQYEAFAFSLCEGDVIVRNESHADPENHEYRVEIEDDLPTKCACPADEHSENPCKHRVAIALRTRIIEAATDMQTVADGGVQTSEHAFGTALSDPNSDSEEVPPPGCEHLDEDFPCWECVRTGRREIPERN